MSTRHSLVGRTFGEHSSCYTLIPDATEKRLYVTELKKFLQDMEAILDKVITSRDDFLQSTAFSHYFFAEDQEVVMRMYEAIFDHAAIPRSGRDVGIFKCGDAQNPPCLAPTHPNAFAYVKPGDTKIVFCNSFFKDDSTHEMRQSLDVRAFNETGWCQDNKPIEWYAMAATTVIHEMTHLDVIGKAAGLPKRPLAFDGTKRTTIMAHGTMDVWGTGDRTDKSYYSGVSVLRTPRLLKMFWDKVVNGDAHGKYIPKIRPRQNAESYSAAALEYYFISKCGWSELPHVPEDGGGGSQ